MFSETLIAHLVDYQAASCQGGELDVISSSEEEEGRKKMSAHAGNVKKTSKQVDVHTKVKAK